MKKICADCGHFVPATLICKGAIAKTCYTKPGRVACLLFEKKKDKA